MQGRKHFLYVPIVTEMPFAFVPHVFNKSTSEALQTPYGHLLPHLQARKPARTNFDNTNNCRDLYVYIALGACLFTRAPLFLNDIIASDSDRMTAGPSETRQNRFEPRPCKKRTAMHACRNVYKRGYEKTKEKEKTRRKQDESDSHCHQ
jgi:hypothetical protein